jgi:hypothetical protein
VTVSVSSGNVAKLTILRSGSRMVLDAEWSKTPTAADIEELNRLLRVGDKALNVNIEDDARRDDVARGFLADQQKPEVTQ